MASVSRVSSRHDTQLQQMEQSYVAPLLLWGAGLTVLRIAANALANTDLFFDEAQYWFWSRELAFGYYSKPPMIGWIIRGVSEICGSGEACIRTPSALFHAGTALVIFLIGRTLYGARTGFWSGLTYATLPGVSLSSSLISTDVPLLFFVSLALFALLKMRESAAWGWALLLGGAIGLGLMSKYAMVYFLMCFGLAMLWIRDWRALLRDWRLYAALALAAAILAPNIIWNMQNSFATFSHTADNANWKGSIVKPLKALDFIGGQFGVFGPILFAALLAFCVNWLRNPAERTKGGDKAQFLLAFSVPVIFLMTMQAFLSRAHANWAAFAYIAATVLIVSAMLQDGRQRLLRISFALHLAIAILVPLGGILAGGFTIPGGADPYSRVLGWKALSQNVAAKAGSGGFSAIAVDNRALAAELLYYLRDLDIPIVSLRGDGPPSDHFELMHPLTNATPRPILFVSHGENGPEGSRFISSETIAAGLSKSRKIYFHALEDGAR